jgi:hypothetical protein
LSTALKNTIVKDITVIRGTADINVTKDTRVTIEISRHRSQQEHHRFTVIPTKDILDITEIVNITVIDNTMVIVVTENIMNM